jgi:regulator of protease activity HflC (stomatin/prohibitin superfamily)
MQFIGAMYPNTPSTSQEKLLRLVQITTNSEITIILGILVNGLLAFMAIYALRFFTGFEVNLLREACVAILFTSLFFLQKISVEIGHIGVPTILGRRNQPWTWLHGEGSQWTLWPIMGMEIINMQGRIPDFPAYEVNAAANEWKLEMMQNDPESAKEKENIVRVKIDAFIEWLVVDPWLVLSWGESVIETGLLNAVKEATRNTAIEFMYGDVIRDKTVLTQNAKKAADLESDRWGIWIKDLSTSQTSPVNPEITKALEKRQIAAAQAEAANLVLESAEKYRKFLELPFGEHAIVAHHRDVGSMDGTVSIIGDEGDPILRAAATHASLRSRPKTQPAQPEGTDE